MAAIRLTALRWRKSSSSGADDCVEVAFAEDQVFVRDSKSPDGSALSFTPKEWEAFVTGVHNGEFDT